MITKVDAREIPGRACSYNNSVSLDVMDFYESGWDACEVSVQKYKNVNSASTAYKNAIRRLNIGVIAAQRNGRLFLIRVK